MFINRIDVSSLPSTLQPGSQQFPVKDTNVSIFSGRSGTTSSVPTTTPTPTPQTTTTSTTTTSTTTTPPANTNNVEPNKSFLTLNSGVSDLEYTIDGNKIQKRGRVSMTGNAIDQFERNSKKLAGGVFSDDYNSTIRKIIGSKNENEPQNMLTSKYRKYKQNLSIDLAIYQDLAQKSEITDAEKKFMNNFEQRFQNYIDILSE